ncbi:amidase [Paraburkholderia bannensis]|uniref:amidase n=1 Tax=Paraburkholderia bannensis TaxID=765414 RepID=UPI002ABE96E4|nr:amidase [Paraburkholderia bannensis]
MNTPSSDRSGIAQSSAANIPAPTPEDVLQISRNLGLGVSEADAGFYAEVVAKSVKNYDTVFAIAADAAPRAPSGRAYVTPPPAENTNNAWYVRSSIVESKTGRLAGRRIAIKDSIPVAGIPMLAGANIFEGYVPEFDAEVVRRILAAGGEIAGKAHCEYLCFSGSSHTSVAGRIQNPWADGFSSGGSSSGSAVLVASGEVDMALGADQAGSIRMPASFSGIVGIKPTYGLVPYTGIAPLDASFDHVGPMTATVSDAALLLSVIAGPDGSDARQHGVEPADYEAAMAQGVKGLRIGVLKEGFEVPGSDPAVGERVRNAAKVLEKLGATLVDVSVPLHMHGFDIWTTIGWTGMTETVLKGNGFGISRNDQYPISMMEWARDNAGGIDQAPPSVKLFFVISEYAKRHIGYVGYGNGINAGRVLRRKYDELLKDVDLLLMPTTPMTATPLPDESTTIETELKTSHPMALNTSPFDFTHHPALTLPCGGVNGMPVGLMLVGRHYDEATVFRAAKAYEATGEGSFR